MHDDAEPERAGSTIAGPGSAASAWLQPASIPVVLVVGHAVLLGLLGRAPAGVVGSNVFQLAAAALASISCGMRSRGEGAETRRPWLLVAAACGVWALGQTLYTLDEIGGSLTSEPVFRLTDGVFLAYYLPLLAALFVPLAGRRRARFDWVRVFDVSQVGIVLCSAYLYVFFFLAEVSESRRQLLGLGYVQVWDLLNLTVIGGYLFLALSSPPGALRSLYSRLTLPMVAYAAGDCVFNYLRVYAEVQTGSWVDLAYSLPFAMVARVALRGEGSEPGGSRDRAHASSPVQSILPSFMPVAVLAISLYLGYRAPILAVTILIASFVCFCLRLAVTQHRQDQAIEQLRSSELRARDLVENAGDVIFTLDAAGVISTLNGVGRRILGIEEPAGTRLESVVAPADREPLASLVSEALAGETPGPAELEFVAGDGRRSTLEVRARPSSEGKGVEAIARDITERRDLERRLLQSQKMEAIGLLAGGVAHDFNNMLNIIFGYCELLSLSSRDEKQREKVDQIMRAAERAASLTQQLLAFGRRQLLAPRTLDPGEVVRAVEGMARRLIPANIGVVTRIAEAPRIRADPAQLELALLNLAINARDAMPGGGTLTLEVDGVELGEAESESLQLSRSCRYARLAVGDTGQGMSPEISARVFEPFFTTKLAGRGTGLGLAIVYGIVRQSGGEIGISSEPGKGTTFTIHLPEATPDEPTPPERAPRASRPRFGSETVLLVEDEGALRELIAEFLTSRGFTVIEAGSAEQALDSNRAHEGPLHALVSDVVLPGASGRDLARELSQLRPGIRTILMTGYSDALSLREGGEERDVRVLGKPVSLELLLATLNELLEPAPSS